MRTDAIGPGQRFAIAAMEVCGRVFARDNEVTIRWVPTHHGIQGNEKADEFAKAAAGRAAPCCDDDVPDELRWEASLSHMTRPATEARSRATVRRRSPTASASAGTGPLRGEAPAASTSAAQEKSWPEGIVGVSLDQGTITRSEHLC